MAIRTFSFSDTDDKWDAGAVYDTTQAQTQGALNVTTGALAALKTAGNNGKVLAVQNGAFAAVEVSALIPDGDEVSY